MTESHDDPGKISRPIDMQPCCLNRRIRCGHELSVSHWAAPFFDMHMSYHYHIKRRIDPFITMTSNAPETIM